MAQSVRWKDEKMLLIASFSPQARWFEVLAMAATVGSTQIAAPRGMACQVMNAAPSMSLTHCRPSHPEPAVLWKAVVVVFVSVLSSARTLSAAALRAC
jgi:hypothetical protein